MITAVSHLIYIPFDQRATEERASKFFFHY